ncbi:MAG: hypothetical protein KAJ24_03460, partial [Candidatus Aenigmarchaeota archaeon]|nr:hypothetical protein [Candidatus Aenigmarchaeota archaeon]
INASTTGSKTAAFNITSPVAGDNVIINVSIKYVLPHKSAETKSYFVMNNTNQSVIEIIRETPQYVSASKVFESSIVAHNKGCLPSSGLTLQETIKEGWTPANPDMLGDVSLISSSVNLEDNYVTWQLGDIAVNQYAVLKYQIKASVSDSEAGYMWWNLTFDGTKEMQEFENFTVRTANYSSESHLEYDIEAIQRDAYPWSEPRSVQPNMTYNYTLKVTNIGDAAANNWSVFIYASAVCNITEVFNGGTLNSTQNSANWSVNGLSSRATVQFNFTANCTETEKQMFGVASERDTRNATSYYESVSYSCSSGEECSTEIEPLFDSPSMPYQEISNINMSMLYEWSANNLTIGEGYVYLKDDNNNPRYFWQNYSLANYNAGVDVFYWPGSGFVSETRKIDLHSHADGTENKFANVTISKINYTWDYGKIFSESTDLFVKSKVYTYAPLVINSTLYISGDSSSTLGGWGEEFNFSVEVRDRFDRDVVVYLWHKTSAASVYTLVASDTCSSCGSWTVMNFTYDYQPGDKDTWVFKFNTTNDDGATELAGHTYIIEQDNVSVTAIWPPVGAIVNRSVSTTFSIRALDTDNQTYANNSNSKIWLDDFTYGSYESAPPILTSDDGW